MTVIEIRPHAWGWKVFEALNSDRSVSLGRQGRLDYVDFGTYVPRI
jgi:hypothetical protein